MKVEVIKRTKKIMEGNSSCDIKLKVCAYARVSTDSLEQQSSFKSQQQYYREKISNNPNWIFVDVYTDEGISGTRINNREGFLKMVKDAEEGKIDLVLTKSISRFARNTLDTLKYVRLLRSLGIAVLFEEEQINTLDMSGELLLTVLASVAQQESETISAHVKLGFKMKRERGEAIGGTNAYGYKYHKDTRTLSIIEPEAKNIKMIFNWYVNGYGSVEIAKLLTMMNIISPTGKSKWNASTVMSIIKNERYIGDIEQGKTYVIDPISHRHLTNKGAVEKYYIKDHHEAIVSREIFEKAKRIREKKNEAKIIGRKEIQKYNFSGRFRCGFCGMSYIKKYLYKRKEGWDCFTVQSHGRIFCKESKLIYQDTIEKCFMEGCSMLQEDNAFIFDEFINKLTSSRDKDYNLCVYKKVNNLKLSLKEKFSKLVDLYLNKKIDESIFNSKCNEITNDINNCDEKLKYLENKGTDDIIFGINKIKNSILKSSLTNDFDYILFDSLIEYGVIGGYEDNNVANPYLIRFICKSGLDFKTGIISNEDIVKNSFIDSIDNKYISIIDFYSKKKLYAYKEINGRNQKVLIDKVRVRFEIEKDVI